MSRYIDADVLHKAYMELRNFKQDPQSGDWISLRAVPLTTVIRMLNDAPSIDIEPKRGEWKIEETKSVWGKGYMLTCSECGDTFRVTENALSHEHFCRNCGADMRKESER